MAMNSALYEYCFSVNIKLLKSVTQLNAWAFEWLGCFIKTRLLTCSSAVANAISITESNCRRFKFQDRLF